jgi:hypothetical protein
LACEAGLKTDAGNFGRATQKHFARKWGPVRHRNCEKCTKSGARACSILAQIDSIFSDAIQKPLTIK